MRQRESRVRIFGLDAGPTPLAPPQPPGWAHLVTVRAGVAVLSANGARLVVSRETAAWIPAQVPYALDLRARCELRIVYLAGRRHDARGFGPLLPTPLLTELIERLTRRGYLDPASPRDTRLLDVIEDEIAELAAGHDAHVLAFPRSADVLEHVERLIAQPAERLPIAALAAAAGMSLRGFERRFALETGLAPREWLRRARLSAAVVALAGGASVTEASLACGYDSLSAFINAFRSVYGTTPGRRRRGAPKSLMRQDETRG